MRNLLASLVALLLSVGAVSAQTYPSPIFQNLTVLGTCTGCGGGGGGGTPGGSPGSVQVNVSGTAFGGVTVANGQILVGQSSGAPLSTSLPTWIAAVSGGGTTNFLRADGTFAVPPGGGGGGGNVSNVGTPTVGQLPLWVTATTIQGITLGANTVAGNVGGGILGLSMPSCQGGSNALNYTLGTGFSCLTISGGSATSVTVGTTTIGSGTTLGLLYNNAGVLGNLATANNGVLVTNGAGTPTISTTLPSGLSVPSPTVTGSFTATNLVTLGDIAQISANTILGNTGSGLANVVAVSMPSCSGATNALIYLSNTGFGCNTISGGAPGNPTATIGTSAVNGSASTYMRSDGAPAAAIATNTSLGYFQCDNQTLNCTSGIGSVVFPNRAPTTNPTIAAGDMGGVIFSNVSGGGNLTIPAISSTIFPNGKGVQVTNYSSATEAVTVSTSPVNAGGGCSTSAGIPAGYTWVLSGNAGGTTIDCTQSPNTQQWTAGVVTALGAGLTLTSGTLSALAKIAGTAAMGTGAIASGACASAVTATATGAVSTDTLLASFNSDPTAVTGYIPSTSGMLTIIVWPTANTANFKVCNNTGSSVTPGAITLNWEVVH